jgi:hypothetical protein
MPGPRPHQVARILGGCLYQVNTKDIILNYFQVLSFAAAQQNFNKINYLDLQLKDRSESQTL